MDKRGTKALSRLGTDYENRRKPDKVIRENLEKASDVLANHQNQFSPHVYNGFMNATRLIDVGLKAPDRAHRRHPGGEIEDFSV
ncbi:hypothetical protein [Paraburkholderia humisilvae]|uniref:Uncharacterized protein n=1 Tax=Paraburkholderia humisilvae TaxID=627669 RepID=A0A6J5F6B0_9BURK|nr:hypothetical protein [Paraburkholderia humisilvae]CAB3773281.1 hypothetical protein LMG29542_07171 [Paraburkholderia humisilvae]